jgi:ribosomal protein L11 methyltransferase
MTEKKHWTQLCINCKETHAQMISDYLSAFDALAVSIVAADHKEIFQYEPNEQPLWEKSKILALFNDEEEALQAAEMIDGIIKPKLRFQIEDIEDQDWVRESQKSFPPQSFGACAEPLWVLPSWEETHTYKKPFIRIDPGVAFGTGTHPTTGMCLAWLAEHPPENLNVIDYGCGSGILSLAALALGADHVLAVDHDDMATDACANNGKLNDFISSVNLQINRAPTADTQPVDLIIANILANPLIDLAPEIMDLLLPGGTLVLSGILSGEADHVVQYYRECKEIGRTLVEDWACVTLKKN